MRALFLNSYDDDGDDDDLRHVSGPSTDHSHRSSGFLRGVGEAGRGFAFSLWTTTVLVGSNFVFSFTTGAGILILSPRGILLNGAAVSAMDLVSMTVQSICLSHVFDSDDGVVGLVVAPSS